VTPGAGTYQLFAGVFALQLPNGFIYTPDSVALAVTEVRVPEPSITLLVALGVCGIVTVRRRRRGSDPAAGC
jgi:hypothetical protein